MPSADDRSSKPVLTCSLCGKSQHDLSDLVGGPEPFIREFICDECVRSELAKSKSAMTDHLGPQASSGTSTGSSMFEVRLLNDDLTPMEFVVYVLQEVFELEHDDAVRIMFQTHHEGSGGCGAFPRGAAQTKAAQTMDLARQHRYPLRCCCVERSAPF
jgi:ATP-dependent Clp protease adaptor protein ClpS